MERRAQGRAIPGGSPRRDGGGSSAHVDIVEDQLDGLRVLALAGELDLATAPALCVRLDRVRRSSAPEVVVDLTDVGFCDSTGLRALIGAGHEYAAAGGEMAVVPPAGGPAGRLFALTGAREFLSVYATREAAARARAARHR